MLLLCWGADTRTLIENAGECSDLATYFNDFVLTRGRLCWSATVLCAQNRFLNPLLAQLHLLKAGHFVDCR